ncbi:MAG: GGDEF domain-containing protein [Ruminiclostridium sp.]|nr:GGDEF domain-containing protein [Ruminiclostridium sp.]
MKYMELIASGILELKKRIPVSAVARFKSQNVAGVFGRQILSSCVARYNCKIIPLVSVLIIIFTLLSAIISGAFLTFSPLEIAGIALTLVTAGCGIGFGLYFKGKYPGFYYYLFWGLFIVSYFIRVTNCIKTAEGFAQTVITVMVICAVPITSYAVSAIMLFSVPLYYTIVCCINEVYFYYCYLAFAIAFLGFILSAASYALFCTRIINSKQIKDDKQIIKLNAIMDDRTGLYNRRYGIEKTNEMISAGKNIAILIVDIDRFGEYNRSYGTKKGDKTLQQIANCVKIVSKPYTDVICHIESDKIMVCTAVTSDKDCIGLAEDIRSSVRTMNIDFTGNKTFLSVTVSVGIARNTYNENFDIVYEKAFRSLNAAKKVGGNCVAYKDTPIREEI